MKTEIIKLHENDPESACLKAAEVLAGGGTAAFPTDTVYGLGALYSDTQAIRKIFTAKGRPENKPLSILVSDISQVEMLAENIPEYACRLMKAFWPGALTLIFKKKKEAFIPDEVTAGTDTIGFRMPDSRIALKIIETAGSPVAAPSANLSGRRSACSAQEVLEDLDGRIDLVIDGGTCPIGISSTVLDMSGGGCRVLRKGSISLRDIEEKVGKYDEI